MDMPDMDAAAKALAEHGCASVCTRFFHHLDRREYEHVAALMADGGVWNRGGTRLEGANAVLDALRARPSGLTTRHLLSNVVVDLLDGGAAARVSYELSVFTQDDPAAPARHATILTGEDRLEHDGTAWRIRLKEARPLFRFGG